MLLIDINFSRADRPCLRRRDTRGRRWWVGSGPYRAGVPGRLPRLLTGVAFLLVGAFLSWLGALGLLAYIPGVGTSGRLTVAHCAPVSRGGVSCTGMFTTPDGEARTVTVEGIDREGSTVDATVYPWDTGRAYARAGTGSLLRSAGTVAFGCVVFAIGAFAALPATGLHPRLRRHHPDAS